MVIATPVTVVSAITSAARHGVLVKGGEYLETLGRTCAKAFDKTGSLTDGRLAVSDVEGLDGTSPNEVLRLAVLVGDGTRPLGLITPADHPRQSARDVLRQLERLGVHEQIMLTGDHELVARSIARQLGIETVRARLLPEDKVRAVEELRREHRTVAMLGDGVNDAPALAAASVGIAMGAAGSPATIETADVALMADDLGMLPYAVRLAKRARCVIMFNIGLALGLKLLLAGGAVAGVVSLMVVVLIGDMGASLAVTLNAMRLAQVRAPRAGEG
jgi:Cd2+/Zn2+-exporting ATPase